MYTEEEERVSVCVNLFNNNKWAVNMHTVNGRTIKIPLNSFHLKEKNSTLMFIEKRREKTSEKKIKPV